MPNVKGSVAGRPQKQTRNRQQHHNAGAAGQLQPVVMRHPRAGRRVAAKGQLPFLDPPSKCRGSRLPYAGAAHRTSMPETQSGGSCYRAGRM